MAMRSCYGCLTRHGSGDYTFRGEHGSATSVMDVAWKLSRWALHAVVFGRMEVQSGGGAEYQVIVLDPNLGQEQATVASLMVANLTVFAGVRDLDTAMREAFGPEPPQQEAQVDVYPPNPRSGGA